MPPINHSLVSAINASQLALKELLNAYLEQFGQLPSFVYGHELHSPPPNFKLKNCRLFNNRLDIIKKLGKRERIVEVGTQTGLFAKEILEINAPKELHVIDQSYELFRFDLLQDYIDSGQLILHEGDSSFLLSQFKNNYFDYAYIDADHSYKGFCKDLNQAVLKIKEKGYIICNDYTFWSPLEGVPYGVASGINKFCTEEDWEFSYFALNECGYHDVALKKIDKS